MQIKYSYIIYTQIHTQLTIIIINYLQNETNKTTTLYKIKN